MKYIDTYQNLRKADPKFYKANGKLTAYALHCGYVQEQKKDNQVKQLYCEHEHYHVKYLVYDKLPDPSYCIKRVWEVFDTVNEAWKYYNSLQFD